MTRVRVKICGITLADDARHAESCGADAIGLVFYPGSARCVSVEQGVAIARAAGPFLTTVALFVNPEPALVREVLAEVKPRLLQFHGDESPAFCEGFAHPYLKAIRVRPELDLSSEIQAFGGASGILFDTWQADAYGGTGKRFDWALLRGVEQRFILAGGLNPDNVAQAIDQVGPYGVDVSGGVESSPGVKDPEKVSAFINAVHALAR